MNKEEQVMEELFEGMAMQLVAIATDDFDDKEFEAYLMGDLLHLQVRDSKGDVCLQVVGSDSIDLAKQLVLACFHNISIEHLGDFHLRPLNRGIEALKGDK